MKRTDKEECPKCGSKNIKDKGDRGSLTASDMGPGGAYSEATIPIYRCNECDESFYKLELNENS